MKQSVVCAGALLVVAAWLAPAPARAQHVTSFDVDCRPGNPSGGTYTSVQQAIDDLGFLPVGAAGGPTNIRLFGECVENVTLRGFDRVVFFSEPGDGGAIRSSGPGQALTVDRSSPTRVDGVVISGGVQVVASQLDVANSTLEGSGIALLVVDDSAVVVTDSVIRDAGQGIQLRESYVALRNGSSVENHSIAGIVALGSRLRVEGGSEISGNGFGTGTGSGIFARRSTLIVRTAVVSGNAGPGVALQDQTTASVLGTITGNDGGAFLEAGSSARFFDSTDVSGNGKDNVTCTDQTSWVAGDLSGVEKQITCRKL